jgi:hypothetical protein
MEKKRLGQLIESLHAELNAADSIDDESRSGLESLTRDIEKLARSDQSTAESRESAAAQLEESYPGLNIVARIAPDFCFEPDGEAAAQFIVQLQASGARL